MTAKFQFAHNPELQKKWSTKLWVTLTVALLNALCAPAHAASTIDGSWNRISAGEFFGDNKLISPLPTNTLQILRGEMALSPRCMLQLTKTPFYFSTVFQMLLKQRVSEDEVRKYLKKKFEFDLSGVKTSYEVQESDCAGDLQAVLFDGKQLIAVASNSIFYSFKRVGERSDVQNNVMPGTRYKYSSLPFNLTNFTAICVAHIPMAKGVPKPTEKCAPDFYPYVATKSDTDTLAKLVGNHRYVKGEPGFESEYDRPVAKGLHPVFLVFPPRKGVTLLRVDDLDAGGEDRNVFSGAYLSIVDGKVVDQLNEGCDFSADYTCVDNERVQYRLLDSGRFQKMK